MAEQKRLQTEWMKDMEARLSQATSARTGASVDKPPPAPNREERARWAQYPRVAPASAGREGGRTLRTDQPTQRPAVRCFNCNKLGHLKRNCRSAPADRPDRASVNFNSSGSAGRSIGGRSVYVRCTINQQSCLCLVDTGSKTNLLPARLAEGCRLNPTGNEGSEDGRKISSVDDRTPRASPHGLPRESINRRSGRDRHGQGH